MTEAIVTALQDAMIASNALLHERDRLREKLDVANREIAEGKITIGDLRTRLVGVRDRAHVAESDSESWKRLTEGAQDALEKVTSERNQLRETLHDSLGTMPSGAMRELIIAAREALSRGGASWELSDICRRVEEWLDIWEAKEPTSEARL